MKGATGVARKIRGTATTRMRIYLAGSGSGSGKRGRRTATKPRRGMNAKTAGYRGRVAVATTIN